jgi:hypothetical protein
VSDSNAQLRGLLGFFVMAKQKTDEALTARIEAAKVSKAQADAVVADVDYASMPPPPSKKPRED